MKKLLFTMLVAAVSLNAGLWTSMQSMGDKKVTPTPFALDTHGWNVRGYVFDVPNSNRQCVILYTESEYKSPPMECWEKKGKQ